MKTNKMPGDALTPPGTTISDDDAIVSCDTNRAKQFPSSGAESPTLPRARLNEVVLPKNSWFERYMDFARQREESSDSYLAGAILPVVAACLGRQVRFPWGEQPIFSNVFVMLAGNPATRKSRAIMLADKLARAVLPPNRFLPECLSVEALFDEFDEARGGSQDKILMLDDANPLLGTIEKSNYGERVGERLLTLYDCRGMSDSFRGNRSAGGNATGRREITATSTSIALGATFNVCRFSDHQTKCGLQRRFNYYVATGIGRLIILPPPPAPVEFKKLASDLKRLTKLNITDFSMTPAARDMWADYQKNNRHQLGLLGDSDDLHAGRVASQPTHVLKLAMIFESAMWLDKPGSATLGEIEPTTLQLAIRHSDACVEAAKFIDTASDVARISSDAEVLHANVCRDWPEMVVGGKVRLSKTNLTRRYCHNSGRRGALLTNRLYDELIPRLVSGGKVEVVPSGRQHDYVFLIESGGETQLSTSASLTNGNLPSALGVRIGSWFKRAETTAWSENEKQALRVIENTKPEDDDLAMLEAYYTAKFPDGTTDIRRHNILNLLNNWPGEIDRARRWEHNGSPAAPEAKDPDYFYFGMTVSGKPARWHYTKPPTRDQFGTDAEFKLYSELFQKWFDKRGGQK